METRKKRATELIEKCDVKVFSTTDRTHVVQIYDRRVKVDLDEGILDNVSLYSILRSWVQDDPDKQQPEDHIRVRRKHRHTATMSSDEEPVSSSSAKSADIDDCLTIDSKVKAGIHSLQTFVIEELFFTISAAATAKIEEYKVGAMELTCLKFHQFISLPYLRARISRSNWLRMSGISSK